MQEMGKLVVQKNGSKGCIVYSDQGRMISISIRIVLLRRERYTRSPRST